MKIAFDVAVSKKTINFLKRKGFDIVYQAGHKESDLLWFNRALALGADVFISGDSDIGVLVAEHYDKKIKWLRFQGVRYANGLANDFLLKRLTKIQEIWGL